MLFFIAALAHQYAPNIELMDNIKVAFLSGGWVGESMHEHLFYGVFGDVFNTHLCRNHFG